jgi:hypothetical protein
MVNLQIESALTTQSTVSLGELSAAQLHEFLTSGSPAAVAAAVTGEAMQQMLPQVNVLSTVEVEQNFLILCTFKLF